MSGRIQVHFQYFNPRPREEGDQKIKQTAKTDYHFNPRPREEGDAQQYEAQLARIISIHALVKRATYFGNSFIILCNISIHALVKRATVIAPSGFTGAVISIHALVKRAT